MNKRDSRDWTLGLASIRDMRTKLAWEVRQVLEASNRPAPMGENFREGDDQAMLFAAANAFVTAWHLMDWLAFHAERDGLWVRLSEIAGVPIADKRDLKAWLITVPEIRTCLAICVATKHVGLSDRALDDISLRIPVMFDFYFAGEGDEQRFASLRTATVVTEIDGYRQTTTVIGLLADLERWWDWLISKLDLPDYPANLG
jgi:hypothetical protein